VAAASERPPSRPLRREAASARTRTAVAARAGVPLLSLSGAKKCFCLFTRSLQLVHAGGARGPLSVGLRPV